MAQIQNLNFSISTSQSQAEAHYRGSRHAKKLKSQENKAKAKLSNSAETNGSVCNPAGPAPLVSAVPVPLVSANSSTNQHTGSFLSSNNTDVNYVTADVFFGYCFIFVHFPSTLLPSDFLSRTADTPSPVKSFLLPSTSPLSSSSPSSSRAGSEPPPSSPPLGLPAPGLSSSSLSSSSKVSSAPAPVTTLSCPAPLPPAPSQDASPSVESEEEKAKKLLYCSLCKVAVNSLSQLEAHNAGEKRYAPLILYDLHQH